jgi:hypothetical protein
LHRVAAGNGGFADPADEHVDQEGKSCHKYQAHQIDGSLERHNAWRQGHVLDIIRLLTLTTCRFLVLRHDCS